MTQMIHVLLLGMFLTHWSLLESLQNSTCDLSFQQESKTWIDALKHCMKINCSLVVITSETMERRVECCLKQQSEKIQNGVWIGLERSIFGCEIPWMWISREKCGEKCDSDIDSNVNSSHYCGKIVRSDGNVKFLSGYCFDTVPFICEC